MKRIAIILALMTCISSVAPGEEPHVSARERAKRQLAVRAAAQKIVDSLQAAPVTTEDGERELVAELGARMRKDVKAHGDPKASRTICLKHLVDERLRALDRRIDDAVARAREHSALPLKREDVAALLGDDWTRRARTEADAFAARSIDSAFSQARRQSVALQRDELKGLIRMPTEKELDARLTTLAGSTGHHPPQSADLDGLTDWLSSFAAPADRPLFKEVQHSTREAAQRVIGEVRTQYNHQLTSLSKAAKTLPDHAIDAKGIRGSLQKATETAIQALQVEEMRNLPDERATIYGPLTVIRQEADRMAGVLEEERLDAAIRRSNDIPLETAAVESTIRSDLAAHRNQKQSRTQLLSRYTSDLTPWFSEQLATRAGRRDDSAFLTRIRDLLTGNARLATSVSGQVAQQLDRMLPEIRERVAQDQLRAAFGALPATLEALTPEAVEAIWVADRCQAVKKLQDAWLSLQDAELIVAPAEKGRLLDEAQRKVIDTCNRLIPTACRAMREQGNQLHLLEKDWTPRLQKDVESGRPIEKIAADWTGELNRRWIATAEKQKLPYPDLFARTLDLLDKTVRKLFESQQAQMEKEAEEKAEAAAEPAPEQETVEEIVEEPPPEETPEDATSVTIEEMLETLDFVLFFRDAGQQSEAVLLNGDGVSHRIAFDAGNIEHSVDAIYEAIKPAIATAARSKAVKRSDTPVLLGIFQRFRSLDLKMAVLVGSKQVRHMTSILLRNRVEVFVEDWNADPGNPTLELEWEDNLEIAQ
ncbi:MAG: hypothetical protein QGH42_09425 [Kiritimatiellia bacterium]|jgi:hypothetical protein|nr:hypothetical protein [Kiritimatiellia bacterium]MDP6629654.1 hypothetical protein [Kiritimatiellia bacterium]MDP6811098.1 hypothetical protein [Kiritimatiellia bacterium]MDP7024441.1 hypothetical protein [Kiritimatiellia bacterium]